MPPFFVPNTNLRTGTAFGGQVSFIYVHRDSQGKVLNIKHGKGSGGLAPYNVKGHGQNRLYPAHLLGEYDPGYLILAEGEPDVVTLISQGFQGVTGTAGAGSVPKDLSALSRSEKIYICFDNDEAGRKGALKSAAALSRQCPDSEIYISHWSESENEGFDVTDFFARGQSITDFTVLMLDGAERYFPVQVVPETRVFEPFSPRLDLDRLTPALREFLRQASPTTDAPDEFLMVAYLTHWAGVVGNKLLGTSGLRPNLWTVLFAGSSAVRKSTALTLAGGAAKVIQKRFDAGLKEAWAEYKADLLRWESKMKVERAEAPEPEKPVIHSLLLPADFSDAGFYEALKHNPISGVIVASEFADFHKKLNRDYTAQADAFLSAYDNERMSRQTRSHELEMIEEPTFSILGATTFENFRRVFRAFEMETGFFQRIFPVAIPAPTKVRKLYLQRSEMEPDYVQTQAQHIKAWLDCPGDVGIEIPPDTTEAFSAWETGFVSGARGKYGERIGPHIERMVPGCLKLAMLCESLEVTDPEGQTTLTLSTDSLLCAQMLVENLFLPSVNYLLEEEIVYGRERMNEKKVERTLKDAGGALDRTALMQATKLSKMEMDGVLSTLEERGTVNITSLEAERPQGGGRPKNTIAWIGA